MMMAQAAKELGRIHATEDVLRVVMAQRHDADLMVGQGGHA
jgi:hypothetical protein